MSPLLVLLIPMFISVAFPSRPLGIGMHFQALLSPLLKVPRMVLLSSLLPGQCPGEYVSPVNSSDSDMSTNTHLQMQFQTNSVNISQRG